MTKTNFKLTKIDARRRQFISDILDELRMPLTIIRGKAKVTLRMQTASHEDYMETLTSILEQSVNLSHLVDDLLFLTRAEMHQRQLELAAVDLPELIEVEADRWQRRCENRVISVSVGQQLGKTEVQIDKPRIRQVLFILIDNTIRHFKPGRPIDISINQKVEHMVIVVTDTGDGISATEIDNVFERFVRFSRHDEGLGLGLPIAKAVIEDHGGKIVVDSIQFNSRGRHHLANRFTKGSCVRNIIWPSTPMPRFIVLSAR